MRAKALVVIPKYKGTGVEVKPLILCRYCKWWKDYGENCEHWLPCQEISTPSDWYCASGEEREDKQ